MSSLSFTEKRVLEDLLEMGGGYVLDFSDATYYEFFKDHGIDIEHRRYHARGRSKAKRMRTFWELASDSEAGHVLVSLFEYVEATGGTVTDAHRRIAQRLLGEKPKQDKPLTEDEFLEKEFGELNLAPLGLSSSFEATVEHRLEEIKTCLKSGAPLAAILLMGSTVEAILLNLASTNPADFNRANSAPKSDDGSVKKFHAWSLNDLINVAHELGKIGLDVKKFSHGLRDFRNYIHPFQQASSGFQPTPHTARVSWQVLRAVIAELTNS